MRAARFERSPRLQRVHALLADGLPRSTLDIARDAGVCAANSCIAELRVNGAEIECRQIKNPATGDPIWLYRMTSPVPQSKEAA